MSFRFFGFSALLFVMATSAYGWDPIGDITNPGRILRNIEREAGNAGREIDRMRLEAQAQAGAPAFEAWLIRSRNDSLAGSQPIPPEIRSSLTGFFSENTLNSVRFKIGDSGVFNLAQLSIRYGGAGAVTLIDTIVFSDSNSAYHDASLWAHELTHVEQFSEWGVRDFAIRYLRSWNSVENAAYDRQRQFDQWARTTAGRPNRQTWPVTPNFGGGPAFPQPQAFACTTMFGTCPMLQAVPPGSQCYCSTMQGPIWGMAQ